MKARNVPSTRILPRLFAAGMAWTAFAPGLIQGAPRVVLNEIHFHPPEKRASEFIELHNPGAEAVSLSKWSLEKFVFAEGQLVTPGSFVVVATDPSAFRKEFGFDPLGPLSGKLRHSGERLHLRDATGKTVDSVRFSNVFPWPVAAAGEGSSLERVHPDAPSESPGSWRSSGYPVQAAVSRPLIPPSDAGWRWRPGTSEASAPPDAWRKPGFTEDATWKNAQLSIGYGDDDDKTLLPDMQGRYTSVFLRRTFEIAGAPPQEPLLARIRVDDGCIVWLNGVEILRLNVPAGELPFHATGLDHEAPRDFESYPLARAHALLKTGGNLLAVQVFNVSKDSSALSFDIELRTQKGAPPDKKPTPGRANSVLSQRAAPAILEMHHAPEKPRTGEAVVVTVHTEPGVASAELEYQQIEPGAYIRRNDKDFESAWKRVPLTRNENTGDAPPSRGVFTGTVPGELQKHRHLVRYRVRALSAEGLVSCAPREDDPCPNRAWFVYDGFPAYEGAIRPGKSPSLKFSPEFLQTLPCYHLLAQGEDVARSQWDGAFHRKRFFGTLVVDGKVYDHIQFHNRGQGSAHISGKNKWGLRLSRHAPLAARRNDGAPYGQPWDSLNLNPGLSTPYLPVLCGVGGLDEALSFRAYQLAGAPASHTHWIHWRVITEAQETTPQNPFTGDLQGLYLAVRDTDGDWLKELGLPDGNVYSTQSGRKHLAHGAVSDGSDWNRFLDGVRKQQPEAWWRANLDLPAYYGFHAMNRVLANVDLRPDGNHAYYRHPDGRWAPIPWDLDMMFVPRHHQPGIIDAVRCLDVPTLRLEYQNRAREILDLFCSDPAPDGGQVGQLLAELSRFLQPAGHLRNWPELDAVHWNFHPRKNGHDLFFRQVTFGDHFGGRWERRLLSADFAGFCRYLLDFTTDSRPQKNYKPNDGNALGYGYGYLAQEAADAQIPAPPLLSQSAPDRFGVTPFRSPGPSNFRALEWRLAAVGIAPSESGGTGRYAYELEPVWTHRSTVEDDRALTLPAGVLKPGRMYRLRARYENTQLRTSHWSQPILLQTR